jgi:DNA-binding NtrC family response regulator
MTESPTHHNPPDCAAETAGRRILVVDDDAVLRRMLVRMLRPIGMPVSSAGSVDEAWGILDAEPIRLVLTDLRLGAVDGDVLLDRVRARWPTLPVLLMTNHGTIDLAVDLMKRGANDFITKPIEPGTLLPRISKALEHADLVDEVHDLRHRLVEVGQPSRPLVGKSAAFRAVTERLPVAARSEAPVLITGETGTGKELVARALHDLSPRADGPFVPVNCGAVPEALMESELFGHVKGAFTDARADKRGLAREAEGGTLFLDEIGEMPVALQVKLLRFLQEREVRPVGSSRAESVDVRVVAATHQDIRGAISDGRFREDLYYRLNVVPLRLPPLRERPEDLPELAAHLLERAARGTTTPRKTLTPAALAALRAHSWPGNIRELENVLHRALIFCPGDSIDAADLELEPATPSAISPGPDLDTPLREAKDALVADFEAEYVVAALRASGGNVAQAARRAGKDRKSFHELIQRYDIDVERFRA